MNRSNQASSAPRGAADDTPVQAPSGHKPRQWWIRLREGLQLANQLVIASPVRLPPKVAVAVQYMNLALIIWESLDDHRDAPPPQVVAWDDDEEAADAP